MVDLTSEPIGTWTSLADPSVAEIAADSSFDFVVIDTEHTPLSLESVANCLRAVDAADGTAVVRVPWNDPVRIKRVLDLGPDGLLVPMVETPDEAREAVAATRYPPDGIRGVAGARASQYGRTLGEAVTTEYGAVTTILQIETAKGIDNADEIAAVDGVDALFVGPADLSASLEVFGHWSDPTVTDAIQTVLDAGSAVDKPVGTLAITPDQIEQFGAFEYSYLIVGVDTALLQSGYHRLHEAASDAL